MASGPYCQPTDNRTRAILRSSDRVTWVDPITRRVPSHRSVPAYLWTLDYEWPIEVV